VIEVRQTDIYADWFAGLKDREARARITVRIRRLSLGNPNACPGEVDPVRRQGHASTVESTAHSGNAGFQSDNAGGCGRAGEDRDKSFNPGFRTIRKMTSIPPDDDHATANTQRTSGEKCHE
jgi:hypothetical protein